MSDFKKYYNPWDEGGEYWNENALSKKNVKSKSNDKWLGGEVTNDSDTSWLISGASNSESKHFIWLPKNKNSDNLKSVNDILDGDVDAVWPAGKSIKNYNTGEIVTSGAFKLRDHRNTNISGNAKDGYVIWDFSVYYSDEELPAGWELPSKFK